MNLLKTIVVILNTIGFIGYLVWLVTSSDRIFYTQDGVLFLLPCVPFFFVYLFVFHKKHAEADEEDDDG